MISIEEAQQRVFQAANRLDAESCRLAQSLGLVLAEAITSDIDMPPYDKALVDGYAVRSVDLPGGRGELDYCDEIVAGQTPTRRLEARQAARIMTGAPIPDGADTVVMLEKTDGSLTQAVQTEQIGANGLQVESIAVNDPQLRAGQNIMRRGTELTRGQLVLESGTPIRPAEIGLLAAVGRANVLVFPRPTVAVISTGNEIVEAHEKPGPSQIRNSNGPTLAALAARTGGVPSYLGIAWDSVDDLLRLINKGLEADLLLLSGGVSAGQLDLVPRVLQSLGVREVFHKVDVKPGKPVWFGVREREASSIDRPSGELASRSSERSTRNAQHSTLVFGLPGNPVSAMVCFELFVRPAFRSMMGFSDPGPHVVAATLTEDRSSHSERPTYWPAWIEQSDDGWRVRPVVWKGSPDLRATTDANCFAIFPSGDRQFRRGERIQVLRTE